MRYKLIITVSRPTETKTAKDGTHKTKFEKEVYETVPISREKGETMHDVESLLDQKLADETNFKFQTTKGVLLLDRRNNVFDVLIQEVF